MFDKRIMFIFILLIVAVGAISCVNAQDLNSTQNLAIDDDIEITQDSDDALLSDANEVIQTSAKITPVNLIGDYKKGNATFQLTDANTNAPIVGKTIKLTVVGSTSTSFKNTTDEKGMAVFYFKDMHYAKNVDGNITFHDLYAGTWHIKADVKQSDVSADTVEDNLTIRKIAADISVKGSEVDYGYIQNLNIALYDSVTGKAIAGEVLKIKVPGAKQDYYIMTDANGACEFYINLLLPGTYYLNVTLNNTDSIVASQATGKIVIRVPATLKAAQVTAIYNSGKYFKISAVDSVSSNPVSGLALQVKIYTGSTFKTVNVTTNSKGVASFKTSGLSKGTHKVIVSSSNSNYSIDSAVSTITINPKKLTLSAKYAKIKSEGKLVVSASDNNKPLKGIKLQIKVFTGKKYKTFNLKTKYDKKAKANCVLISTSKFSSGVHKVTVKVKSPNYKGSKTFSINFLK